MTTEHKFTIPNVTNETSGVCVINLPFSVSETTKITVKHDIPDLKTIAKVSSFKTIKLIWFSNLVKPIYNVTISIDR